MSLHQFINFISESLCIAFLQLSFQDSFRCRISTCFFRSAVFIDILVIRDKRFPSMDNASGKKVRSSKSSIPHFSENSRLSFILKYMSADLLPVRFMNQFVNLSPLSLVASKIISPFGKAFPQALINLIISSFRRCYS